MALFMQWLLSDASQDIEPDDSAPPEQRVIACMGNNIKAAGEAILQGVDIASGDASTTIARITTGDGPFPLRKDCFKGLSEEEITKVRNHPDYHLMLEHIERQQQRMLRPLMGLP